MRHDHTPIELWVIPPAKSLGAFCVIIVSQGTQSMHVQGHELSALWNQYDFLSDQDGAGLIVQWAAGLVHCDNCSGGIIWVSN